MAFFFRYSILVLFCVVLPFGFGFYRDTLAERERATATGKEAAQRAPRALQTALTVEAHESVSRALRLAQKSIAERWYDGRQLAKKPEDIAKAMQDVLPRGGFVWMLAPNGEILAKEGTLGELGRNLESHPIFVSTQHGYAHDGVWFSDEHGFLVGAAPFVVAGDASGAVMVGVPLDEQFVATLADRLAFALTLVVGDRVMASTLDPNVAELIVAAAGRKPEPTEAGRWPQPMKSPWSFLPLFVPKDGSGIAYTSASATFPDNDSIYWVLSIPSADSLRALPARQFDILLALVGTLLLAIFIGLTLHRTFVSPIHALAEHLSGVQSGRGERELNEFAVSKPFRRIVKLVNMLVLRWPTTGATHYSDEPADNGPMSMPSLPPEPEPSRAIPRALADIPGMDSSDEGVRPLSIPPVANTRNPPSTGNRGPSMAKPDSKPAQSERESPAPETSASKRMASEIRGVPSNSLLTSMATQEFGAAASAPAARPSNNNNSSNSGQLAAPAAPKRGASMPSKDVSSFDVAAVQNPFARANSAAPRMGGSAAYVDSGSSILDSPFGTAGLQDVKSQAGGYRSEATKVGPPSDNLIARTARDMTAGAYEPDLQADSGDRTLVAKVPKEIMDQAATDDFDDDDGMTESASGAVDEAAHFRETYEAFLEMRKTCGEPINDIAYDRFVAKLRKNRDGLIKKYNCRTVRFQVYEKDGKAALKATPIRR